MFLICLKVCKKKKQVASLREEQKQKEKEKREAKKERERLKKQELKVCSL